MSARGAAVMLVRAAGGRALRRIAGASVVAMLVTACGSAATTSAPPTSAARAGGAVTALVGGRVQPSPDAAAIPDGVVLIDGATITAVGARDAVAVPPGAAIIDCAGGTVTAGFWNSHVHFMEPVWGDGNAPAGQIDAAFRTMLTSRGVVHALDTGSSLGVVSRLQRRIASGELTGPHLMRAAGSFVPVGGSPFYVLPARLPELTDPATTARFVDGVLDEGAEGVKLFTGSWGTPRSIVVMPLDVVRAATETAHRRGKFVIAHPSNSPGARVAIEGGVDILAHTFPTSLDGTPWDRALPGMMIERRMALVPTLKLLPDELRRRNAPPAVVATVLETAQAQLRTFSEGGGQVLFGTDVGYMRDYDTTDEYVFMQQAGLTYAQILAALTTAPAARFGAAATAGRLARGYAADVVVLDGDPAQDIRALAKVRSTLRAGRVIYGAR